MRAFARASERPDPCQRARRPRRCNAPPRTTPLTPPADRAWSATASWSLSVRDPAIAEIAFTRIVNKLRCHRAKERVRGAGPLGHHPPPTPPRPGSSASAHGDRSRHSMPPPHQARTHQGLEDNPPARQEGPCPTHEGRSRCPAPARGQPHHPSHSPRSHHDRKPLAGDFGRHGARRPASDRPERP